ncbi:amino acid permease-domain-containing protein [Ampelomyces quisqualis]|uniref:Amino acid permease-domain-containing protein n=1 Tax=Ampelomyces quisqualis TaxID=50730 RepID=A0A6A5QRE0_AMPQU|nr:amino acid permease-domain-containing protein [Ampelomyces quisqualis]
MARLYSSELAPIEFGKDSRANVDDEVEGENYHDSLHGHTRQDRADMLRMGKVQELKRNYRPLSALAFTVILQGTWEVLMTATYQGLLDGGPAGLIWSFVWTWFGFSTVMLSLAEMASMAPTAGGQYHWVSEFSPPRLQRPLSFFVGWMSTLSWQAGTASGPFLVGTLIQSSAIVMYPDYAPTNWQGTLMVIAVTVLVWALNIWGTRSMPIFQNIMLLIHVFGFLTIIIVFWVLSPRNSAEVTFTKLINGGGWSSIGLTLMVGQLSAIYACICSDSAAHMSEEIKDAGKTVPKAMIGAYLMNGSLGIVFLVSYMFMITDVEAALNDVTGYPHIWVFSQTVSAGGVAALNTIPIVLIFAGTLTYNLSTSRQTWAFARDRGLPFSGWIGTVNKRLETPANAVSVTCIITIVLSLINIGSDVAFNAIISLNVVSLMITYVISIGAVLYRRLKHPELLPTCQWSLGRWGVPVNVAGMLYSFYAFFWCFWPEATPVELSSFNWAVVMFLGTAVLAGVDYAVRGRKQYKGPVVLVNGYKEG